MTLIKKFFLLYILSISLLFSSDKKVIEFEEKRITSNPNVKLEKLEIKSKKVLKDSWIAYIFDIKVNVQGKTINANDILFSNGSYITTDLLDINSGLSMKNEVKPNITNQYYKKDKLLAGNHKAKEKIVVFSDPLCPYCMSFIPQLVEFVEMNEDNIALYYYHFPLIQIHPAAFTLSKLVDIAKIEENRDLRLKVYEVKWSKYFSSSSKNNKVILESFNKVFKTNITIEQLNSKIYDKFLKDDIQMGMDVMVNGTPTLFVNGKLDYKKTEYLNLGKR